MPLSRDPTKRARQLANLRRGVTVPPPGNVRRLQHGAHALGATRRLASEHERRIFTELAEDAPVRDVDGGLPAADRTVVGLLASCLARLDAVDAWLAVHGTVDEKGRPYPALTARASLDSAAAKHCDSLGMTPRARVSLGLDLVRAEHAAAAARDLEEGRRLRLLRDGQAGVVDVEP
jgi:Phage terminase, small subunit